MIIMIIADGGAIMIDMAMDAAEGAASRGVECILCDEGVGTLECGDEGRVVGNGIHDIHILLWLFHILLLSPIVVVCMSIISMSSISMNIAFFRFFGFTFCFRFGFGASGALENHVAGLPFGVSIVYT